ncbi:MAG: site-specific DNA-methyltransferase [Candidatus Omnitrophica bacterium]|nr:site-specific DNA-methyltransferase [Candidatus Omnitrophota bacterium]
MNNDLLEDINKKEVSSKVYFQTDSICIYNDDFLKIDYIKDNSIDLIVTSPPYNVDIHYNAYNDKISYYDYLIFTRKWLAKCFRLAKNDGRFCLNIPLDKNKGGQQSVYADITTIAKQVGWKYHSTIIWNEQNISRRTAWGSWLSARAPYVIAPVEVILVLYKKYWRKENFGKSDITKEEFVEWTNGVWTFSGESRTKVGHPAPFPIELPRRCIKLFSYVGDTILDPFLGSGSTLIASVKTDRKGIGIEIDKNYCKIAKQRLIREAGINQLNFNKLIIKNING